MNLGRTAGTQRLINKLGGVSKTAKAFGVSAAAVSKWTKVPPRHDSKVKELTGCTRDELEKDTSPNGKNAE
jgi:predicted transcriptional regulator